MQAGSGEDRIAVIVGKLAFAVALVIALVLPAGFFAVGFIDLLGHLETMATIKAGAMTALVAGNPELWTFQVQRLEEVLVRFPIPLDHESATLRDARGNVLAAVGDPPRPPVARASAAIFDSGQEVGQVEIVASARPIAIGTVLAGLLGLWLAGLVYLPLRTIPLRALKRATAALYEEKERAQVTLESIGDAVVTTNALQRVEYLNPVAERLTGWTLAEACNRPVDDVMRLINEITREPVENPLRSALAENRVVSIDHDTALLRRDGRSISVDDSAAPIRDISGKTIGGVMVFRDVTAARSLAQRISWQATHDALTGLINRREFEGRVDAALTSARNSRKEHAVCIMDLDRFKVVNDTCGHAAGDVLLKDIASLLQARIRASDSLARVGGDEFGLLLDSCPPDRAQLIAADLLAAVKDLHFHWGTRAFNVGISIGLVSIGAGASGSRDEVLAMADAACFWAKEQGRNCVRVYSGGDSDEANLRKQMDWVSRINLALEQNRLVLYYMRYQPLNAACGEKTHVEMLLRMIDENGRLVLPGSFIPAAERYNLMPEIDRWVIRTAFAGYAALASRLGGKPLVCSINLSGTTLNSDGMLAYIRGQADGCAIPPGAICFEITETAAINNLRRAAEFMKEVKAMGFMFALDDFGTGTSFFGYLRNFPVDYLKIDGGFVKNLANDLIDQAMAETIARIGRIMGIRTVAEYAENGLIIDELRKIGVDYAQGYGVGNPEPLVASESPAPGSYAVTAPPALLSQDVPSAN